MGSVYHFDDEKSTPACLRMGSRPALVSLPLSFAACRRTAALTPGIEGVGVLLVEAVGGDAEGRRHKRCKRNHTPSASSRVFDALHLLRYPKNIFYSN